MTSPKTNGTRRGRATSAINVRPVVWEEKTGLVIAKLGGNFAIIGSDGRSQTRKKNSLINAAWTDEQRMECRRGRCQGH